MTHSTLHTVYALTHKWEDDSEERGSREGYRDIQVQHMQQVDCEQNRALLLSDRVAYRKSKHIHSFNSFILIILLRCLFLFQYKGKGTTIAKRATSIEQLGMFNTSAIVSRCATTYVAHLLSKIKHKAIGNIKWMYHSERKHAMNIPTREKRQGWGRVWVQFKYIVHFKIELYNISIVYHQIAVATLFQPKLLGSFPRILYHFQKLWKTEQKASFICER